MIKEYEQLPAVISLAKVFCKGINITDEVKVIDEALGDENWKNFAWSARVF